MRFISVRSAFPIIRLAILISLLAPNSVLHAQSSERQRQAGIIVSRQTINLPQFQEISDRPLIHFYANEEEYERARQDGNYAYERLTYMSDGLEVVCFLYRPNQITGPQPTIVFNRGGYIRNHSAAEYLTTFHRFAADGYTVLAPMYRGSEGAEGLDEMGGADLNDLMRVAALADELRATDSRRLFLLGESRGGMMVLQAIREGFPAFAAAIVGSPTDFFDLLGTYPERYGGMADQLWPEWRVRPDEILGRRSAVEWAERIDIPLLIMHGGNDQSMPVTQSLALAARLQDAGKKYELHIFGYENHAISTGAVQRDAIAAAWYKRHAPD
jgi:dipeptidyl aminopeptidase/acylaminoacyl peptidase